MNKKATHKGFIIVITAAVLLPLLLFIITKDKTKGANPHPPFYIVDGVDSEMRDGNMHYDTVFHTVADLELTNQLGDKVSLNKDLKNKILIVSFFFADCPSVCPKMMSNIAQMQKATRKNDTAVQFISITVSPEKDTVQRLRVYAESYGANHDRWWFLTGDRKSIYNYARNELHVTMQPGDGGMDDFIHSEKVVMIDKERNIRGYFNGQDAADLTRCLDQVVLLTLEKDKKLWKK
jgi:protein SCO1/2